MMLQPYKFQPVLTGVIFLLIYGLVNWSPLRSSAWQLCSDEEGGGTCPDNSTCCPTKFPGTSACVPIVRPEAQCCNDNSGCRVGYICSSRSDECADPSHEKLLIPTDESTFPPNSIEMYCKAPNETLDDNPSFRDTARYGLCRVPLRMQDIQGFPIVASSDQDHSNISETNEGDVYHLGYYSSVGSITSPDEDEEKTHLDRFESIKTAMIVIHGSLRDADDYFCTGLSLIQDEEKTDETVMILAPKFASSNDDIVRNNEEANGKFRFLIWEEWIQAYDWYLWHIWRYGADAANAPISSYTALDSLVEYLVMSTDRFPNLERITLVGHSAGGQTLQRWALLSNSPAWQVMDMRVVVANPRSYAYLDDRRWFPLRKERKNHSNDSFISKDHMMTAISTRKKDSWNIVNKGINSTEVFRRPSPMDDVYSSCPWYNHWLWGLEDGGEVLCPYKDSAVGELGSARAIAKRYAGRNVIYLSGEDDTIPQTNDRCGNSIQGETRHERAVRFFRGLEQYFGKSVHAFHTISHSNHDHALMFQSPLGRNAILGDMKV